MLAYIKEHLNRKILRRHWRTCWRCAGVILWIRSRWRRLGKFTPAIASLGTHLLNTRPSTFIITRKNKIKHHGYTTTEGVFVWFGAAFLGKVDCQVTWSKRMYKKTASNDSRDPACRTCVESEPRPDLVADHRPVIECLHLDMYVFVERFKMLLSKYFTRNEYNSV